MTESLKFYLDLVSKLLFKIGEPCYKQVLNGVIEPNKTEATLAEAINVLDDIPNSRLISTILKHIKDNNRQYTASMKQLALYFYLNVGPTFFEFLQRNLKLPSLTTTKQFLSTEFEGIIEGKLRVAELSVWLEKHRLPRKVWIAEDATRIVRKVLMSMFYEKLYYI